MFRKLKNYMNQASIFKMTLTKIFFIMFAFLLILTFLHGQIYWERETLKTHSSLISITANIQTNLQSQVVKIQSIKKDDTLTHSQKNLELNKIIQIINNNANSTNFGYYDLELDSMIMKTKIKTSSILNLIRSLLGTSNEYKHLAWGTNSVIMVSFPIYYDKIIVGYAWAYAVSTDILYSTIREASVVIILSLIFSVLMIVLIKKHVSKIQSCLEVFYKNMIDIHSKPTQPCSDFPELTSLLTKINHYIDDLKQNNLDLESSKDKVYSIMEGISDGFYTLDRDWQFTFVNNETQKFFSDGKIELLGRGLWEVFPDLIDSLTMEKLQQAMFENVTVQWEAEGFIVPDQQFYRFCAYPFKEGLTVIYINITEYKKQQNDLARLERLNLIGQLAAGISHEIRNPLTTVKGFLQFFGSKFKYSEDKENMDLMVSEIDRANEIITDFLSLSKATLDNNKLQNINEIINKVFPMLLADAYNSNKEVVLDLNAIPIIMLNESEIKQLILNLVRNGLDVTPQNGSVIISTYLQVDRIVLAIRDHGTGIPKEIQEKIGTPFFTTKETGTGLGLAISIGIAERHKAIFKYETDDNGTVFQIIFPTSSSYFREIT